MSVSDRLPIDIPAQRDAAEKIVRYIKHLKFNFSNSSICLKKAAVEIELLTKKISTSETTDKIAQLVKEL